MPPAYATYEFVIDWDGDRGVAAYDFERSVEGWTSVGAYPPDLVVSPTHAKSGTNSLKVTWHEYVPFTFDDSTHGFDSGVFVADGFATPVPFTFDDAGKGFDTGQFSFSPVGTGDTAPYAQVTRTGLLVGRSYTVSAWAYVPSSGGMNVKLGVVGKGSSSATNTTNTWQKLSVAFTATATSHVIRLEPTDTLSGTMTTWLDYVSIQGYGEDITPLRRVPISITYGRDQSRALNPVRPGETSFEVLDVTGQLSPLNTGSPLYDYLRPGRPSLIRASYNGTIYNLYRGTLDDYSVNPGTEERSVTFSFVDALASLESVKLSTLVYQGARTGDLVNIILDYAGWPEDLRDLDAGATVVRYWWEEGTTAAEALDKLVASEGPPSYIGIGGDGAFVFRDRHHRLLRTASTTVQATMYGQGVVEPLFSEPFSINFGWKDEINTVRFDVENRVADPATDVNGLFGVLWSSEDAWVIPSGSTQTIDVSMDTAAVNIQTPRYDATRSTDYNDFILFGAVNVSVSRTSGAKLTISLTATTNSVIFGMKLRGAKITNLGSSAVTTVDDVAKERAGQEKAFGGTAPTWAGLNDAIAIADIIIGQRSRRLPTVSLQLNNATDERLTQILTRNLSDRVRIVENRSLLDKQCFLESISHNITDVGKKHTCDFGFEAQPDYGANVPFTFDDGAKGFDTGVFGYSGLSDASTVFILDSSLLGTGLLAN